MSVDFIIIGLLVTLSGHFSEGNTQTEEKNNFLREAVSKLVRRNYPEIFLEETKFPEKKDVDAVINEDKNIDKEVLVDTKGTAAELLDDTPDVSKDVKETDNSTPKESIPTDPPTPKTAALVHHKGDSEETDHIIGIPRTDFLFITITTGCSLAAFVGLIIAGVCWYKLHKNVKAASEVEYPAYGVTGPSKERMAPPPGDRKLAQSAQMYHYQHQKQQMIAMEKANGEMKHDASEDESEEENEEGDYTVYECPGLAPTGEMEVRNPLFSEETSGAPGPEHPKEPQ
ncbi:neural proliferation differentiation and control protein 1-like [Mizuhopecten yessoensis]|uniref:Neural proliferation differentiation and control protein 1 n=1 Tax=Mizuhopecten yessoensis TaxID=6573 RepID=A0A210PSM4_MIZYE|nr:neural proliferation differentiation and control protein 1-like [Mizuhopecten yessoensis]OWF39493.1 Neural proliferation differentiation and control protein 1 [Mizuhopecten yessoensis]